MTILSARIAQTPAFGESAKSRTGIEAERRGIGPALSAGNLDRWIVRVRVSGPQGNRARNMPSRSSDVKASTLPGRRAAPGPKKTFLLRLNAASDGCSRRRLN
jgi:hypothetical protein